MVRRHQARHQAQGGGFARAGAANDAHGFAPPDGDIGAPQHRLAAKGLMHVAQLDEDVRVIVIRRRGQGWG